MKEEGGRERGKEREGRREREGERGKESEVFSSIHDIHTFIHT